MDKTPEDLDMDFVLHCDCGKEDIIMCNAEICEAQWLPVIYVDPDWPNKEEE